MNFTTHYDLDAPIDYVFTKATDFGSFERQALRRGANVARFDGTGPIRVGSGWDVAFTFRGKDRKLRATIDQIEAPSLLRINTAASGLDSIATIDLTSLSPKTTRLAVTVDMSAKSMSARLLLQSLKLARGNLNKRFDKRIKEFSVGVEDSYKTGA